MRSNLRELQKVNTPVLMQHIKHEDVLLVTKVSDDGETYTAVVLHGVYFKHASTVCADMCELQYFGGIVELSN